MHKTSRFGDVLINTAKVIFETHGLFCASGIHEVPDCRLIDASMGYLSWGMRDQTSEAFAYIEREYNDVKGRVELQRHVVAQLHRVEADAGEAEAALYALLDDEASKLRILDYLRKWRGDNFEEMPANRA